MKILGIVFILSIFPLNRLLSFIHCDVGARPSSMGDAYVALSDDIISVRWNPAGLSKIRWEEIVLGHSLKSQQKTFNFAYSQPLDKLKSSFGTDILYNQQNASACPDEYNFSAGFFYSKKYSERINIGANMKFLENKNAVTTRDKITLDLGLLVKSNIKDLDFGLASRDIGTSDTEIAIGSVYKIKDDLTVATDFVVENSKLSFNSGLEYLVRFVAVRAGYTTKGNTSFGVGLGRKLPVKIDYGYVGDGTHHINLIFSFGRFESKKIASIIDKRLYDARRNYERDNLVESAKMFHSILWFDNENKIAKEYLKKIELKKQGLVIDRYISEGKTLFSQNDLFNSKECFESVLLLDKNNETAKKYLEMIKLRFEEIKEVEKKFLKGKFFYEKNDYENAFILFGKILELEPENTEANRYLRITLAELELKKEKEKEAEAKRIFEEAVLMFNNGKVEEALGKFESVSNVISCETNIISCKKYISEKYIKTGVEKYINKKYIEANGDFKKVISLDPDNIIAVTYLKRLKRKADEFYILGKKEYSKKNMKIAIINWGTAIELNPDHREAKSALERVRK